MAALLSQFAVFTYHEDFYIALVPKSPSVEKGGIRPATLKDLPFVEKTYPRSGHEQLLSRINQKQLWVMANGQEIKGCAGIHKDGSLGFEYVAPNARRQHIASKMQAFVANKMYQNNYLPYVYGFGRKQRCRKPANKIGCCLCQKAVLFLRKRALRIRINLGA